MTSCDRCIHRFDCPWTREFTECNDYEPEEDKS